MFILQWHCNNLKKLSLENVISSCYLLWGALHKSSFSSACRDHSFCPQSRLCLCGKLERTGYFVAWALRHCMCLTLNALHSICLVRRQQAFLEYWALLAIIWCWLWIHCCVVHKAGATSARLLCACVCCSWQFLILIWSSSFRTAPFWYLMSHKQCPPIL